MRIVEHSDEGGVVRCRYIPLFFDTFDGTIFQNMSFDHRNVSSLRGHWESATQLLAVTILTNDLFSQGSIATLFTTSS